MFDACKRSFGGKRVALFGSYGWGDGEWMRTWERQRRGEPRLREHDLHGASRRRGA